MPLLSQPIHFNLFFKKGKDHPLNQNNLKRKNLIFRTKSRILVEIFLGNSSPRELNLRTNMLSGQSAQPSKQNLVYKINCLDCDRT